MGVLLNILILVLIALVVLWAARKILASAGVGGDIGQIVMVILALVFIVALINALAGGPMWGPFVRVP